MPVLDSEIDLLLTISTAGTVELETKGKESEEASGDSALVERTSESLASVGRSISLLASRELKPRIGSSIVAPRVNLESTVARTASTTGGSSTSGV